MVLQQESMDDIFQLPLGGFSMIQNVSDKLSLLCVLLVYFLQTNMLAVLYYSATCV